VDDDDFNLRVARRVRELRDERGLSIESLAQRSGVSRAMISRIERGESSPTAVLLNKLSIGLGVLLPALFGRSSYRATGKPNPVSTRGEQAEWRDPTTGYLRRTLTPRGATQQQLQLQLHEVRLPAGAHVTFEDAPSPSRIRRQIWLLTGTIRVQLGSDTHHLRVGDCMAMQLDAPITIHNPGRTAARYLLAITREAGLTPTETLQSPRT
jgi:transcriptional regulator with XRE-family HTH domain